MFPQTVTHEHPWPRKTAQAVAKPTPGAPRPPLGMNRVFARVLRWRRRRRDARLLMEFDDHLLQDIGLSRGEIGRAVRGGRA
jgi:uncharacterized protein YjiS (DUF1127 family)